MLDINGYPIFPGVGALTMAGDPTYARAVTAAFSTEGAITVHFSDGSEEKFTTDELSVQNNTGRITFTADNSEYRLREFRETDGLWLSKYKIDLPVEALEELTIKGGTVEETLEAYVLDDSAYLLGVVYTNDLGRWARVDGDWVMLARDDETFNDMIILTMDMDKSTEFLDLYDNNFVTVASAETYEAAEADIPEE